MCLEYEWFMTAESRKKRRDKEGVTVEEITECLGTFHSTVYPIATEMAQWLYDNWTLAQIYQLSKRMRRILFEIIEQSPECPENAKPPEYRDVHSIMDS